MSPFLSGYQLGQRMAYAHARVILSTHHLVWLSILLTWCAVTYHRWWTTYPVAALVALTALSLYASIRSLRSLNRRIGPTLRQAEALEEAKRL